MTAKLKLGKSKTMPFSADYNLLNLQRQMRSTELLLLSPFFFHTNHVISHWCHITHSLCNITVTEQQTEYEYYCLWNLITHLP